MFSTQSIHFLANISVGLSPKNKKLRSNFRWRWKCFHLKKTHYNSPEVCFRSPAAVNDFGNQSAWCNLYLMLSSIRPFYTNWIFAFTSNLPKLAVYRYWIIFTAPTYPFRCKEIPRIINNFQVYLMAYSRKI